MGYANGGDRLGFFLIDDIAAVAGVVKGVSAIAQGASNIFDPGKSKDQQRQARADFFGQAAMAGSITAARYLLGGLQNTASHEIPMYQAWITQLQGGVIGAQVYQAALAQGPKWAAGVPDPGGTQQMVSDVNQDLATIGAHDPAPAPMNFGGSQPTTTPTNTLPRSSGGAGSGTGGGVQSLPAMHTTAPYNYTPWLIGGGVALAALLLTERRR